MILLKTTDIIRFHLSGAVATNELDFVTSYVDITGFSPGNNSGVSSGASDVTLIGSPTSGIRQVKFISIVNTDTAPVDVTVELYNGTNARVLLTWTINVLDSLTYIDSEGWKVLDASGKLKVTTGGGGGGGSVTSIDFNSLKNRVSANSAQMTSADNALSNAISVLSAIVSINHAANSAAHVSLANKVSVLSVDRISADTALSSRIDTVSGVAHQVSANVTSVNQAISVLSARVAANSADNFSAHNALSNKVSALSQLNSSQHAGLVSTIQVVSNAISIVSVAAANATSIANAASAAVAVVSADLTSVKNTVSVISQQVSVLSARVASNSAQMTSANNAISNAVSVVSVAAANALSVANATSNAVSIVSVAQAATSAAVTSVNNRISGVSADLTSFKASINNFGDVSVPSPIDGQVIMWNTSAAKWLASTIPAGSGSVTSNELSAAVAALSNSISVVSASNALKNPILTIQGEGVTIVSAPNVINFRGPAVSTKLSAGVVVVSIESGGGGSVTSANFASLQSVVQANSAQMTSANNAISNAVSIVSVAQAATSAAVTSVNNRISSVSADLTSFKASINNFTDVSIVSPTSAQMLVYKSAVGKWVNSAPPGGSGSVTSQELSVVAAGLSSRIDTVSNAISVLSAVFSNQLSVISAAVVVLSNNVSVLSNNVSVLSVAVGDLSNNLSNLTSVANVISNQLSALGGQQRTVVQNIQSIALSTYVQISGLSVTFAASAVYEIEGQIVFNVSAISATGYNIRLLASAFTQRYAVGAWQFTSAMAASTGGANVALLNHNFHGMSGAGLSVASAGTAQTNIVRVTGMIATSATGGTLNVEARVLVGTIPMHIFYGSYLIARRLQ